MTEEELGYREMTRLEKWTDRMVSKFMFMDPLLLHEKGKCFDERYENVIDSVARKLEDDREKGEETPLPIIAATLAKAFDFYFQRLPTPPQPGVRDVAIEMERQWRLTRLRTDVDIRGDFPYRKCPKCGMIGESKGGRQTALGAYPKTDELGDHYHDTNSFTLRYECFSCQHEWTVHTARAPCLNPLCGFGKGDTELVEKPWSFPDWCWKDK